MEGTPTVHENHARRLVEQCRVAFKWTDLSRAVIMDVGCGEDGNCGKAVLEKFPVVGAIIFIDNNPRVKRNFKLKTAARMECAVADIEKRETLRNYEGKMDKVISNYVFHQVIEKEEAFRNMYRLLKPDGEAAVLFVRQSLIYDWLTEMLKKPKWKAAYKKEYIDDLFNSGFGADKYREMAEKIGFRVVHCGDERRTIPYPSDEVCKEALYQMSASNFNLPPEVIEEFKEDCLQVVLKLSPRDAEGRPCYRATELSVLVAKPAEVSSSKTK